MYFIVVVVTFVLFLLTTYLVFRKKMFSSLGAFLLVLIVMVNLSLSIGMFTYVLYNPNIFLMPSANTSSTLLKLKSSTGGLPVFNYLFWSNAMSIVSILFLSATSSDKKSLLVDLVGAWNKTDIDNSVENLINHSIENKNDRDWVYKALCILKNYTPNNKAEEDEKLDH